MSQIEIPKGWDLISINSISDQITKGSTPTTYGHSYTDKGITFLRAENVLENKLNLINSKFISNETHDFLSRSKIRPNYILITIAGTIGRATYVPENSPEMNSNQAVAIIKLKQNCLPKYMSYFLNSNLAKAQILKSKVTNTISNLSLEMIGKLDIPLPSLKIQKNVIQKLDYILEQLNEKKNQILDLQNQNKEKLEYMKTHSFRFYLSKFFKYEKLDGFIEKTFSQVTQSFDNLRVPLNKSQRNQIQGSFPYYGASGQVDSINDFKFDGQFLLIAEDGENLNSQKKPIAFIVEGKFWVNNHAHVVQASHELDMNYLCYYLNGMRIMKYAKKQATRPKLKKSDLDNIPIIFPNLTQQKSMVKKASEFLNDLKAVKKQILELIEKQNETISKLNNLQGSILGEAFTGKLAN